TALSQYQSSIVDTCKILTPLDTICYSFPVPELPRGLPVAAPLTGCRKVDDRSVSRPARLHFFRETLVPPEMLVRRSHTFSERSGAPTHSPRGGPAHGARSSRRAKAAGHQGGPRDDLEDEDAGAARERHLAGKARHLRLQGRHHPVRHDEPSSDALHAKGGGHLRRGSESARLHEGPHRTAPGTGRPDPRTPSPRHPRREVRRRVPGPGRGVFGRPAGAPLWPRALLRREGPGRPPRPPHPHARASHELRGPRADRRIYGRERVLRTSLPDRR